MHPSGSVPQARAGFSNADAFASHGPKRKTHLHCRPSGRFNHPQILLQTRFLKPKPFEVRCELQGETRVQKHRSFTTRIEPTKLSHRADQIENGIAPGLRL